MNFDGPRPNIEEAFDYYNARILSGSGWQKAECPLNSHEDANPSASVNIELGKWRCWVCDKKGDIYDLVKENESVGLADAVKFATEHFAPGDAPVRGIGVRGGGLPGRSGNRRGGGTFVPPWSRL